MNGTPELSEGFTQIPNEMLIALAKAQMNRITTSQENAVITFILRYTYGYKREIASLKTSFIAKELGTTSNNITHILKRLENKNIIVRDGEEVLFNKHYKEWKKVKLPNHFKKGVNGITKKVIMVSHNSVNGITIDPEEKQSETERNDSLNITNKYKDKYKKNIAIADFKNSKSELKRENSIKLKDEIQEKAKSLISQFCSVRGIPMDSGFFAKNIRAARSLVSHYEIEVVLAAVLWRLQNDDGFWSKKLWSLNSVYSHIAEWIAEANSKPHPKTFTEYLDQNPSMDYRKIDDDYAKVKAFFLAFSRALHDGAIPTAEEWKKYQTAREINKKQGERQWA